MHSECADIDYFPILAYLYAKTMSEPWWSVRNTVLVETALGNTISKEDIAWYIAIYESSMM